MNGNLKNEKNIRLLKVLLKMASMILLLKSEWLWEISIWNIREKQIIRLLNLSLLLFYH